MNKIVAFLYIFVLLVCASTSTNAQEKPYYSGNERSNPARHDGQLSPVVGVHNIQVMRANRAYPDASNGNGWTYNHQPMLCLLERYLLSGVSF